LGDFKFLVLLHDEDMQEISTNIRKINDLRKANPANQRLTHGTAKVGRDSVEA
jgi:hypothetical protein